MSFTAILLIAFNNVRAEEYTSAETYVLQQELNGVNGTLQLLLDKRLTAAIREQLWGKGDWTFVFPRDSKVYREFSTHPLHKSKLVMEDSNGKLLAARELETPLAKLEAWNPADGSNQSYLLTEDYSAGAGSYNGLVTVLLRVSDATFHEAEALSAESQKEEPIRLVKSLKSEWRIVRENTIEVLFLSCHQNPEGSFVIDYTRYSLDGTRWIEHTRQESGFWEADEPFPPRTAFP